MGVPTALDRRQVYSSWAIDEQPAPELGFKRDAKWELRDALQKFSIIHALRPVAIP
jgi:hypothetical protein